MQEIFDEFIKNVVADMAVELADEFDRNFERKAFFDQAWPNAKLTNKNGSLMARSNTLRNSISKQVSYNTIVFSSSLPYASIHNEGGELTVTLKMKKYFWAKYYELARKVKTKKDGKPSKSKASIQAGAEAEAFKALALKKTGSKIKIPERRFIGYHPEMGRLAQEVADNNLEELGNKLAELLNKR